MSGWGSRQPAAGSAGAAVLVVLACLPAGLLWAQEAPPKAAPETTAVTRRVGTIDLFGYRGWDGDGPNTVAIRQKLAARKGTEVRMGAAAAFRRQVQGDVVAVTGKTATDVAVLCCDERGELNVFVGVQGESSVPLEQRATPTGPEALPPEALALYVEAERATEAAVARGVSAEDDSQGYTLSHDPAARDAQEKMRAYAVAHEDVIARVLRRSGAVQQRRAAATLLGYAQRSPAQVRALEDAVNDDDDEVRNNATRALAVLAVAGPLPGLNPEQIIALLYSGVWTDRNKASALLAAVTKGRDPKLLKRLREQALPPLIEGAGWQSQGHAGNFALVLGRVIGLPEERLHVLLQEGKTGEIVSQAETLDSGAGKR